MNEIFCYELERVLPAGITSGGSYSYIPGANAPILDSDCDSESSDIDFAFTNSGGIYLYRAFAIMSDGLSAQSGSWSDQQLNLSGLGTYTSCNREDAEFGYDCYGQT